MIVRWLVIGVLALLTDVQLVRNAIVQALAPARPTAASWAWAGHPDVELMTGLIAIARATKDNRKVGPAIFDRIFDAARKEPLAPEPFLVRGIQAQLWGRTRLAEKAFLAAKWRDGRSLPARYFLAGIYFRGGDSTQGLAEIATLARLAPNGVQSLAPYIAAYARDTATWPQLKALFRTESRLRDEALISLAADPKNAETVLALSDDDRRGASSPWLGPLLRSLIKDGKYERAREVWAAVSRVRLDRRALLFDPGFTRIDAPPPFSWTLTSSTIGFAERQRGGGLHVIFYGQEDGALASQLLVLTPGQYRFMANGFGASTNADALHWKLTCQGSTAPFASFAISASMSPFTVPPRCDAQLLELFGSSADIPKPSEVTIHRVSVVEDLRSAK